MRKRFLVTGGAGFLGSHLCEELLRLDHEVLCVDNLSTGTLKNIESLNNDKKFHFLEHDVIKPLTINQLDGIFNFACPASPSAYQSDPIQTIKTSILGAFNLLDLAETTNSKIFHASTSEIYGDPLIFPQKESYWGNVNPIGIRACYDESKRVVETIFVESFRAKSIEIRIARIFNTYGSNMTKNDGRVISNFIVQALKNEPITIYGDGSQVRSFCHVDDLVGGILKLFNFKKFSGPVNLGNPTSVSIIDLAREIVALTNSQSKIIFCELPSDDPKTRQPDISKATIELGWIPRINRKEGLERTIDYFMNLV